MSLNSYNPESFTHPGNTLREKLEELNLSIKEFSLRTAKPEKTIHDILNFDSSITPDMAVQFEKVLNIPAKFWLNYQARYNEFIARAQYNKMLSNNLEWAEKFPYNAMSKLNWVPKTSSKIEKVDNLLKFFGFSSPLSWDRYFFNSELKTAFRISLKHTKEPYAISAWLRHGEMMADKMEVNNFQENKFKKNLEKIRPLIEFQPTDFFLQLQIICTESGVKLVYSPTLPKAPISGSTRWINETPVIQVSGRYKKNDIFWFTFLHEAAHILLHNKKDIYLEGLDEVSDKEIEADSFAEKFLLNNKQEEELLNSPNLSEDELIFFAKKFKTHPAILIGRLQHRKSKFTFGNKFRVNVELD
jgi:addiction module HigA family antidote